MRIKPAVKRSQLLKNIIQRTISGVLYLAIIIGSLIGGQVTFGLIFLLICLIALYEFYGLPLALGAYPLLWYSLLSGAIIFVLSFLVSSELTGPSILVLALPLMLLGFMIALYSKHNDIIRNTGVSFLGILYVAVPLSTVNFLAFPKCNGFEYTHRVVLGILILIWINDTVAYLVGITAGRHPLFTRVSPKKSWEGAVGGAILTLICAVWIVSVFGVFGDLTESLFKRNAGLKDSGNLIPGHGGILDRIDSVLFVMPLSLVYLIFSNH